MEMFDFLASSLHSFARMDKKEFELSIPYWKHREYKKGEFYNNYKNVCQHLGFIIKGVFRVYYADKSTREEKNMFFFSRNQILVSFKSFVNQVPCDYHTQAITDAEILYIHIDDLTRLYQQSHQWEHFGRKIAEHAFNMSMDRTECFLFRTPEQRYMDLVANHPGIFNEIPLYHISSYLGVKGPSISRIRKRIISNNLNQR